MINEFYFYFINDSGENILRISSKLRYSSQSATHTLSITDLLKVLTSTFFLVNSAETMFRLWVKRVGREENFPVFLFFFSNVIEVIAHWHTVLNHLSFMLRWIVHPALFTHIHTRLLNNLFPLQFSISLISSREFLGCVSFFPWLSLSFCLCVSQHALTQQDGPKCVSLFGRRRFVSYCATEWYHSLPCPGSHVPTSSLS